MGRFFLANTMLLRCMESFATYHACNVVWFLGVPLGVLALMLKKFLPKLVRGNVHPQVPQQLFYRAKKCHHCRCVYFLVPSALLHCTATFGLISAKRYKQYLRKKCRCIATFPDCSYEKFMISSFLLWGISGVIAHLRFQFWALCTDVSAFTGVSVFV